MNNIIFDNIVFNLQRTGGVSGVWKELISRIIINDEFDCKFLEYSDSCNNLYRNEMTIIKDDILLKDNKWVKFDRFVNPRLSLSSNFIFHSSYYRTCSSKNAINVTTVHDFIYEYFRHGLAKYIHHQQKKNAILASEAIICVSENTKQDLLNFFPKVIESKVFVVHNGVSDKFKLLSKDHDGKSFEYGNYIIYIGNRSQPHKNFLPIIAALEKIKEINLVMIGGGNLTSKEIVMFESSLKNRYYHLSGVSNERLNVLYNYALALVYPSHYEGFGMPIIEAQKAGCPVIAKRGSSITEVAASSAILMEYGDTEEIRYALELLLTLEYRTDIINKGLTNSNRFSWDIMANSVFQIYKGLL